MKLEPVPAQPPESSWQFVDELKQPRQQPGARRAAAPAPGAITLVAGVNIRAGFADPDSLLDTAYADLRAFCAAAGIPETDAGYLIETAAAPTDCFEAYRIEITARACRIMAADTEGIRRGIYCLEDEIARAGGALLMPKTIARRPAVKTRVTRCFFGPIKRPPKMRDELADDFDYYPDNYLARLAYEGVNGLWLTIAFKDLARTDLAPEYGADRDRRLAKLRRTIAQCRRYGIKIYLFAIEPGAWDPDSPILARHPEMGGIRANAKIMFCPFSEASRQFLHDCLHSIFRDAPGLGGLINISLGERSTTCVSMGADCVKLCPYHKNEQPWEILHKTLADMRAGMSAAAPAAELLCWLYVPGNSTGTADANFKWIEDIAGHMPEGVIFQYNFESNGAKMQLGKPRHAGDYWLSYTGPSDVFRECAARARAAHARVSAKLQVGCSHEVATAPYVPVPSALYHKYSQMRELNVSAVMMCWYFGNYPGTMNKAAGALAFDPFPASESEFLKHLAGPVWGERVEEAVRAYELFWKGYENYPVNCMMQYYGPMHDGPVWPLFLTPVDEPLAPTWLLKMDYSGDRIGEAINYSHTLDEVIELCQAMSENWNRGVAILKAAVAADAANPDGGHPLRVREAGIAEALGIHFQSACHIFQFYDLREKLLYGTVPDPSATLRAMAALVEKELALDARLLELVAADSTLGFHPEAEGYKYFPAKIQWRMRQLRQLLAEEFPAVAAQIRARTDLFPEYTGRRIIGPHVVCKKCEKAAADAKADGMWRDATWVRNEYFGTRHLGYLKKSEPNHTGWVAAWQTMYDADALYFRATCPAAGAELLFQKEFPDIPHATMDISETLEIVIEPRRLWPAETFIINRAGHVTYRAVSGRAHPGGWDISHQAAADNWSLVFRLPWKFFAGMVSPARPVRINFIHRWEPMHIGSGIFASWVKPAQAAIPRLAYGIATPAELAWLTWG